MHNYVHLTLTLTALLELSSSVPRHPRSIWPWPSSEPTTLISEKHAEILRQSGYGEYLDLSKHPLWKIHKYEGVDLKPVRLEAETVQSKSGQLQPQVERRNPVSSEGFVPPTESSDEQTPAPDLSFLDDLGGLAYFLPEPEEDVDETEKASILAGAIANEEQSHPGFLSKLWSMIWGQDSSRDDERQDSTPMFPVSLPATKENYAEISLVQPSERTDQLAESVQPTTLNQADQQAFNAGPEQAMKPVAKWYEPSQQFSRSQAWIQSWNPNAAYNVHVEGPSEYPMEQVATVHSYTSHPNNQFQRKVSKGEEETRPIEAKMNASVSEQNNSQQTNVPVKEKEEIVTENTSVDLHIANPDRSISEEKEEEQQQVAEGETEGQVQQVGERLESSMTETKRSGGSLRQKAVSALKMNIVPQKILRQLQISEQEIDDFVNNREGSNKTWDKIRIHLRQLGPRFPAVRRMFFE